MGLSRVEDNLEKILGYPVNLTTPKSRLEQILRSIIDGTTYSKPPLSRIEQDFLVINDSSYDISEPTKSRIEAMLYAIINGLDYNDPRLSRVEVLLEEMDVDQEDKRLRSQDEYVLFSDDRYRLVTRR